jgi:hypothetical protein
MRVLMKENVDKFKAVLFIYEKTHLFCGASEPCGKLVGRSRQWLLLSVALFKKQNDTHVCTNDFVL